MKKIKTIIVDDEVEAREGVQLLLKNDPDIEILGLSKNGVEAIDMINDHEIDLVFLDIQMPVINGFEVVNSISNARLPHIIFVTAYDQYALKAFEVHAIDYILKPFTDQRFFEGLQRAKQFISQQRVQEQQAKLKQISSSFAEKKANLDQLLVSVENDTDERLIVKEKGKVIFIPLTDILWLQAYDYYVKIHLSECYYTIRESLKKLSQKLPTPPFVRIHKSTIINKDYIKEISATGSAEHAVLLQNGKELKASRSYNESIKSIIKSI